MLIAIATPWNEGDRPHLMQKLSVPIENDAVPSRRRRPLLCPCVRIVCCHVSSSNMNCAMGVFVRGIRRDSCATFVERKKTRSFATDAVAAANMPVRGDFVLTAALVTNS